MSAQGAPTGSEEQLGPPHTVKSGDILESDMKTESFRVGIMEEKRKQKLALEKK